MSKDREVTDVGEERDNDYKNSIAVCFLLCKWVNSGSPGGLQWANKLFPSACENVLWDRSQHKGTVKEWLSFPFNTQKAW